MQRPFRRAFSIIELMVVIGIIAVLLAMLFPMLAQARIRAKWIACQSNMHQIGIAMQIYAGENGGWMFPPESGLIVPISQRWFVPVLKPTPPRDPTSTDPKDWTPPLMLCPVDTDVAPVNYHSYLVNHHLVEHHILYSSTPPDNLSSSDVIVLGEKLSSAENYYVEILSGNTTYYAQVDENHHGARLGSNYLYKDIHVAGRSKNPRLFGADPWDF